LCRESTICSVSRPQVGWVPVRSRQVANAVGVPVLRDQGADRPAGHAKTDHNLGHVTPCSQSQIGQDRHLRRQGTLQAEAALALSVVVRSGPVRTAVNGTLMAQLARTTVLAPGATAPRPAGGGVGLWRPMHRWQEEEPREPRGSRQAGHEALNLSRLYAPCIYRVPLSVAEQELL
jgi:hypothetical protein